MGFALLGHAFLSELWITHKWLDIPWHSALEVNIWWKRYYFDGTASKKILEFEYWKKQGIYSKINFINNDFTNEADYFWNPLDRVEINHKDSDDSNNEIIAHPWNAEKVLLSQIYNNKWSALFELKRYDGAIKMYNKAIELNPQGYWIYNNKWNTLFFIKKYNEAILMYDKVIEYNPKFSDAYNNKWVVLWINWKTKTAKLYYFTYELLEKKNPKIFNSYDIAFVKNKLMIQFFIKIKDYKWLRKYLLELEAKDKK